MNGPTNSWLSQFSQTENPCVSNSQTTPLLSNCILWLIAGVILGGLTFQKKGTKQ